MITVRRPFLWALRALRARLTVQKESALSRSVVLKRISYEPMVLLQANPAISGGVSYDPGSLYAYGFKRAYGSSVASGGIFTLSVA